MNQAVVGLKELRENIQTYIREVEKGKSFIVLRRSRPVFRISRADEEGRWETVADFTKVKRGGVLLRDVFSRL